MEKTKEIEWNSSFEFIPEEGQDLLYMRVIRNSLFVGDAIIPGVKNFDLNNFIEIESKKHEAYIASVKIAYRKWQEEFGEDEIGMPPEGTGQAPQI